MSTYDVIVIGCGGVGSAALYHLARRGARVMGLDRFPPGHNRGSSHGRTRMIRLAYYEHPNYVPLLMRAYDLWHDLEEAANKQLLLQTGLLVGGLQESHLVAGVLRAASEHQLQVDELTPSEVLQNFPGFRLSQNFAALFEHRAGYLKVEDCVIEHASSARRAGAELVVGTEVRDWKIENNHVKVTTDTTSYFADRIVISGGAWSSQLLSSLKIPFEVLRKPLFWYRSDDAAHHQSAGAPCFLFETLDGIFYGFPKVDEQGIKIAEHSGGRRVVDPLQLEQSIDQSDQQRIEDCLNLHLPSASRDCTAHAVCMYTMSPDGHLVVGQHPEFSQVAFVAGLSGHGFKFTPVLGEIMADLTISGRTNHPIQFLSPTRFSQACVDHLTVPAPSRSGLE